MGVAVHDGILCGDEALEMYENMLKKSRGMPEDVERITRDRVSAVFNNLSIPTSGSTNSAFLIHSRRMKDTPAELDDVSKFLPGLATKYEIPFELVDNFWDRLPSFVVGEISGKVQERDINCSIISVQVSPTRLATMENTGDKIRYALKKTQNAVQLAKDSGAYTIGLGEILASVTHHGKKLQDEHPDLKIVTGHTGTSYLILEWVKLSTATLGKKLDEMSVTVIGANGSIGSTVTELLAHQSVGNLYLHDVPKAKTALEKLKSHLEEAYPQMKGKIKTYTGNDSLEEACKKSKIIVSAASTTNLLKKNHLNEGTIIIDDSQPPSVDEIESQKAKCPLLWVVGQPPEGFNRSLDYGLLEGGEWGCALEVIATQSLPSELPTGTGKVKPYMVEAFGIAAQKLGIKLGTPQSFGRRIKMLD